MSVVGVGSSARNLRWVCIGTLAAAFIAIVPTQRGIDEAWNSEARASELLLVPEGSMMRRLCLGHEGLLANIYWTRVVQYFGRKRLEQSVNYDLLAPLLRITTD